MSGRPDPAAMAEILRAQRESWSAAAPGWDLWFDSFEAFAGPLSLELAHLAGVGAGSRVLDVGCGNGEPSLAIARIAGPTGRVLGIDLAEPMVVNARRRAAQAGLANVEFRVQDAGSLAGSREFDAAVSRFVLMLAPDPIATARAVLSVLRPGARFAACVWGEATEVPFCALAPAVLQRVLGVEPAGPDAPGPVRLGKPGALSDVLRAAGFVDVEEHARGVEPRFASPAEGARFYCEGSGSARRALEGRSPADRARCAAELERALSAHQRPDGSVVLPSQVRIARGTAR